MKTPPCLLSEFKNKTLTITLNRPDKHNCFGIPELVEMEKKLQESMTDPDIRVIVFRGAGERSFSTGADLKQFMGLDKQGIRDWIRKGQEVFNYLDAYPKPTIAVVQGYALGGGLELALACDFRIASENASFGFPELGHGWLPGWGGIRRLNKIIGQAKTKEMIFLGERISANLASSFGLISRLTKTAELEEVTSEIIGYLLQLDPQACAMAKAVINESGGSGPASEQEIWFDILSTLSVKDR